MKTRKGLVSNSSSSSYVVLIPKDMEVTEQEFKEAIYSEDVNWETIDKLLREEECQGTDDDIADKYALEVIQEAWEGLRQGYSFYEDYGREESYLGRNRLEILAHLASQKGVILSSFDTASDRGEISGVTEETVLKILDKKSKL